MVQVMLVIMMALIATSVPVAVAIGISSMIGVTFFTRMPDIIVVQRLFSAVDQDALLAIPMFILSGYLMQVSGASERLVDFARSIVGRLHGGLACSCILTSMLFAAMSGSGSATTFAVGAILIPAMVRHGYPVGFAAALQATSAELGVIIPPSISMILYGVAAQVSIGDLFIAGIIPGLLIGVALMLLVYVWCWWKGFGRHAAEEEDLRVLAAASRAWLSFAMPVLVLGGIYGGIVTPTEASAVAAAWSFALLLLYKGPSLPAIGQTLSNSAIATANVMLIIAMSGVFSFLITSSGLPGHLGTWVSSILEGKVAFLLGVNLFLFVVGMFIDAAPAILVLAPILAPIAVSFGVDPIHFGIIFVVNLALGMVTPPFGVNLFVACAVAKISLEKILLYLIPFLVTVVLCLMAITFIPELSIIFL